MADPVVAVLQEGAAIKHRRCGGEVGLGQRRGAKPGTQASAQQPLGRGLKAHGQFAVQSRAKVAVMLGPQGTQHSPLRVQGVLGIQVHSMAVALGVGGVVGAEATKPLGPGVPG